MTRQKTTPEPSGNSYHEADGSIGQAEARTPQSRHEGPFQISATPSAPVLLTLFKSGELLHDGNAQQF